MVQWISRSMAQMAMLLSLAGLSAAQAQVVGGLDMAGDGAFDSDSVAASEPSLRGWASYPGARFTLNPSAEKSFELQPADAALSLRLGAFLKTGTLRLAEVATVRLAEPGSDSAGEGSLSRIATWYPYQLALDAEYPAGAKVHCQDFFLDDDSTMIRLLKVASPAARTLVLQGKVNGTAARWDAARHAILVTDKAYTYAIKIVALKGDSLQAAELDAAPTVTREQWSLRLPLTAGESCFALAFGFASDVEGADTAATRACNAFAQPVADSLAKTKGVMDAFLRKVPKPARWGVDQDGRAVPPAQHRQAYYAAWAFVYQNVMKVFPENPEYPYPQMSLGKASLWAEGEKSSPGTCGWESFMGIQWLSFVKPELAWELFEGILSRVDESGKLGGESLPSRKAQTAWVLYCNRADLGQLRALYPAVKRYLLWRERNLRWIYPGNDDADERDLEFAVSWLFDLEYAVKIADALNLPDDASLWRSKRQPLLDQMQKWFFADPAKLHQFYFVNTGKNNDSRRMTDWPIMITTALCLPDLPDASARRLEAYFGANFDPAKPLAGFEYLKYPDVNLTAYGLIDRSMAQARPFVADTLAEVIRAGEFSEVVLPGPKVDGVRPSLFGALTVIENTWLLNGVRYDSGQAKPFAFPAAQP